MTQRRKDGGYEQKYVLKAALVGTFISVVQRNYFLLKHIKKIETKQTIWKNRIFEQEAEKLIIWLDVYSWEN